jgi:hypothetical protein
MYIRAAASISAQKSFGMDRMPERWEYPERARLSCQEPDYGPWIDPKSIRRMSHIIKMGVTTALASLRESGIAWPDAIVTGTAYGCLGDTESFLTRLVDNQEQLLTPTAFIQSTHNTAGAQIALLLQCHGYNNCFVHRGFSFERALEDAAMLLEDGDAASVLVGGLDELTEASFQIQHRFGLFRNGLAAGEGASFFLVGQESSGKDYAQLKGLQTIHVPQGPEEIILALKEFLHARNLPPKSIDLLILGEGDQSTDPFYRSVKSRLFNDCPTFGYKTLCGEYPTSSAFSLWLAAVCLKSGTSPIPGQRNAPRMILIYTHYLGLHHSFYLLSAC